jgi:hypothetical protein
VTIRKWDETEALNGNVALAAADAIEWQFSRNPRLHRGD